MRLFPGEKNGDGGVIPRRIGSDVFDDAGGQPVFRQP